MRGECRIRQEIHVAPRLAEQIRPLNALLAESYGKRTEITSLPLRQHREAFARELIDQVEQAHTAPIMRAVA